jgi:formylglycine-generating enzyme required for sulfatase activity
VTPAVPPQRITLIEMVRINGGTFMMGTYITERSAEETRHQVTVSPFYMGKYEVTQKQWYEVMGTNPSGFKGDNLPVEDVNWYDTIVFCNRLSMKEGLSPAYQIIGSTAPAVRGTVPRGYSNSAWNVVLIVPGSTGYRLPTEAQWEYACRAGTTMAYNTGAEISNNTGWYDVNSGGRTRNVGGKPANAWGLHDMHGNVSEWCWDLYESYSNEAQTDPSGPFLVGSAFFGIYRVMRGGSWNRSGQYLRSSSRVRADPSYRSDHVGLRLVRP